MKLRVEVTEDDIKNGRRSHPYSCPVALACGRAGLNGVSVSFGYLDRGWEIPIPKKADRFVRRFDRKLPVKPFSFTLSGLKNGQIRKP